MITIHAHLLKNLTDPQFFKLSTEEGLSASTLAMFQELLEEAP